MRPLRRRSHRLLHGLAVWTALLSFVFALPAQTVANPLGGTVVAGSASINSAGSTLTVTQQSSRAIINWQGFSIGAGEMTQFVQPGANAAILNRVTGGDPSAILGSMQSNGQVYLINPHGIVFGPNATVNVGSLVATTLNVANEQFMNSADLTFSGNSTAGIYNYGNLEALEGNIYLVASNVANHGVIQASNGTAGMFATDSVTLVDGARPHLPVTANSRSISETGVTNTGLIEAMQVELAANGGNVYGLAINNEGTIRATGAEERGGRIYLVANGGKIKTSGDLIAKRDNNGGDVIIDAGGTPGSAAYVSGNVDVSGDELGGTVAIRAETIDIGTANFDFSGTQSGALILRLGPHSVLPGTETSGGPFLNWGDDGPGTTIMDDSDQLKVASGQAIALLGNGTTLSHNDSASAPTPFDGLMIESADPSQPFIQSINFNLDKKGPGGPPPAATEVKLTIDVREPNGDPGTVTLILPKSAFAPSSRLRLDAANGELIKKITVTSSTTGYDDDGMINPDGVPVYNELKQFGDDTLLSTGSLVVVQKQTLPEGSLQTFDFTLTNNDSVNELFPLQDDGEQAFALDPGNYDVTEDIPLGWELTSVDITETVTDNSSTIIQDDLLVGAAVMLESGEIVTVVFNNTEQGKIKIIKLVDTITADDNTAMFDFESNIDGLSTFQLSSDNDPVDSMTMAFVTPGADAEYNVTEGTVPEGFAFSGITGDGVDSDGQTATVSGIQPGQTVEVTFNNTEDGKIKIIKLVDTITADDNTAMFNFESDIDGLSTFQLSSDNDPVDSMTMAFVTPGAEAEYNVTEGAVPEGFAFSGITGDGVDSDGQTATVSGIQPGQTVEVTFNNTEDGKIKIIKLVDTITADDNTAMFNFESDIDGLSTFQLSSDNDPVDSMTMAFVTPGAEAEYNVTEGAVPEGFAFSGITGDGVDSDGQTATVSGIQPGQTVEVTFNNTEDGKIKIIKLVDTITADDNTAMFNFESDIDGLSTFQLSSDNDPVDSMTMAFVTPGAEAEYNVTEGAVPEGFAFSGITGDGVDSDGQTATVSGIQPGQTVEVTFNNTEDGKIKIIKLVDTITADDNTAMFNFESDIDGLSTFQLSSDNDPVDSMTMAFVTPGAEAEYNVTEGAVPEGFAFSGITGDGVDSDGQTATVSGIQPGQTVEVTFNNTEDGKIKIIKLVDTITADDNTAMFDFESNIGGLSTFQLSSDNDPVDSMTMAFVTPGAEAEYNVTEGAVPEGFAFSGITGDGVDSDGQTATVSGIQPGQTVEVTFNNTEDGKIKIIKLVDTITADDNTAMFDFESNIGGLSTFQLSSDNDPVDSMTMAFVTPGEQTEYNVTEGTVPEGFAFSGITGDGVDSDGQTATVSGIQPGQTVEVTFNNTEDGKIKIIKLVDTITADDNTAMFDFESNIGGLSTFQLSSDNDPVDSMTMAFVTPGEQTEYNVTEGTVPEGFVFSSITGDGFAVNDQTATVSQIQPGQTIEVTFNNTELGTIVVQKTTSGGDETFNFDTTGGDGLPANFDIATVENFGSRTFQNILPNNNYSVTENVPAGWVLQFTVGSPNDIFVAPGETVVVGFFNRQQSTRPPTPIFDWNLFQELPYWPDGVGTASSIYDIVDLSDEDIAHDNSNHTYGGGGQ